MLCQQHMLLENSNLKKGHNHVKKKIEYYLTYWYGSPFE